MAQDQRCVLMIGEPLKPEQAQEQSSDEYIYCDEKDPLEKFVQFFNQLDPDIVIDGLKP